MQLIILVVLAAVVLYQLYAVLGRRVGRQPEDAVHAGVTPQPGGVDAPKADLSTLVAPSGLAAIRSRDPNFDVGRFLQGARVAYEAIVRAFAVGDRPTLAQAAREIKEPDEIRKAQRTSGSVKGCRRSN